MNEQEIEKINIAKDNLLRGTDLEAAALIVEKVVFDKLIITCGRVDIFKIATRQILQFLQNSKVRNIGDKDILDYVKETVSQRKEIQELKQNSIPKQKIQDKIEELKKEFNDKTKDNDSFYYDYSNEYAHIEEVLQELLKED